MHANMPSEPEVPQSRPEEVKVPIDYTEIVKLIQGLSFQTFLILCVGVLSYALVHLYEDNQVDWVQMQANTTVVSEASQSLAALNVHMDGLEGELQTCLRLVPAPRGAVASVPEGDTLLVPLRLPGQAATRLPVSSVTPYP